MRLILLISDVTLFFSALMLLPQLLANPRVGQPFVLLQSTAAQSILPILRSLLNHTSDYSETILFALLYPPGSVVQVLPSSRIEVHDCIGRIPGYGGTQDLGNAMMSAIDKVPLNVSLNFVIDSLEAVSDDLSSIETYHLLHKVLQVIKTRPQPSRLIVHSVKPMEDIALLLETDFSSSIVHLTAHPTSLFRYLAKEYMTSPPPVTSDAKFWGVFISLCERIHEAEGLVFGVHGEGSGGYNEMVVEILTRGISNQSRKRGVERCLEGWSSLKNSACSLHELQSLSSFFVEKQKSQVVFDPTQNLSFNLSLNVSQQEARAKVPLPYAHEGRPNTFNGGTIYYDPDSADDIDDDDPDEDLDI